jgi:hypothetical protein
MTATGTAPGGAVIGGILHRPTIEGDRSRSGVEEFDVVGPQRRLAALPAGVDLIDDDALPLAAGDDRGRQGHEAKQDDGDGDPEEA